MLAPIQAAMPCSANFSHAASLRFSQFSTAKNNDSLLEEHLTPIVRLPTAYGRAHFDRTRKPWTPMASERTSCQLESYFQPYGKPGCSNNAAKAR
jgi:hypothetical protein